MAKLTRTSMSPAEEIATKALAEFKVIDSEGRSITLKKPGLLAQYRLVEVVGAISAANPVYMDMIHPLIYITDLDGIRVFQPTSKAEIEALITRLDEHGLKAVVDGLVEHFGRRDPEEVKEAVKK